MSLIYDFVYVLFGILSSWDFEHLYCYFFTQGKCAENQVYGKKSFSMILLRQKRNISPFKRSPRFMSGSEGSSLRDEE